MTRAYKTKKIGFIGAGNMTRALVSGLLLGEVISSEQIFVSNRSPQKSQELAKDFKVHHCEYADEVLESADFVILAMKPQDLPDFLESYGKSFLEDHHVLSLCAGVRLEQLRENLPQVNSVTRLMPSTTCQFGQGVLGVYSENQFVAQELAEIFKSVGSVQVVQDEEALDGVMISVASGVGFILEIMQIWSEWLSEMGFDSEQAGEITKMSFAGVAEMLKTSPKNFFQLQSEVTSKKGVTLAGLEAMRAHNLSGVLEKAFEAALRRNKELQDLI